jgi:3D (Asp-Asp-Asp) domain-containing protein
MTRNKFDIIDVIVALIAGIILGILAVVCFSPPEASRDTGAGSPSQTPPTQPAPIFTVTAYCQNFCCCGDFADGITASGHIIEPGDRFVAAPPEYPFGMRLSIPGYAGGRMVVIEDRGSAIQGNRLDVFFGGKDGHEEALAWGVREMRLEQ